MREIIARGARFERRTIDPGDDAIVTLLVEVPANFHLTGAEHRVDRARGAVLLLHREPAGIDAVRDGADQRAHQPQRESGPLEAGRHRQRGAVGLPATHETEHVPGSLAVHERDEASVGEELTT